MIALGSLVLSDHLVLGGLESDPPIAFSARRTMGGRAVVQSIPLSTAGRELTLAGDKHFTLEQILDVQSLARLNRPVELSHYRGTYRVLITRVDPEPLEQSAEPGSDAVYSAVIYMVEV